MQADLVEHARNVAEQSGLTNVDLRVGNFCDAVDANLKEQFDLVFAADGVMCHLDDVSFKSAVRNALKMLRAGGTLALSVDDPSTREQRLLADGYVGEEKMKRGLCTHSMVDVAQACGIRASLQEARRYGMEEKRVGVYSGASTLWYSFQKNLGEKNESF